ncbi:MAG: DUF5660 family protein [Patescibacteria group bacterium]|jgi:hypothetical protein
MAGGIGPKQDPKNYKYKNNGFTSEFLKSHGDSKQPESQLPSKSKLSGILGLGQTIEINQKSENSDWTKNFLANHLEQEHQTFIKSHDQEIQKEIEEIRTEIRRLSQTTESLNNEIEKTVLSSEVENYSQYELNFLQRLKMLIVNFRKNISESTNWLQLFQTKKRKRNAFWSNVKKKQGGGEQYLFSGEHSASRSAA